MKNVLVVLKNTFKNPTTYCYIKLISAASLSSIPYHGPIDRPVDEIVQQLRPGVHLYHVHPQVRVEQKIEPQELVAVVPRVNNNLKAILYISTWLK